MGFVRLGNCREGQYDTGDNFLCIGGWLGRLEGEAFSPLPLRRMGPPAHEGVAPLVLILFDVT